MPRYRSHTTTHGRNMAGARALWRATGMQDGDFEKPIVAFVYDTKGLMGNLTLEGTKFQRIIPR